MVEQILRALKRCTELRTFPVGHSHEYSQGEIQRERVVPRFKADKPEGVQIQVEMRKHPQVHSITISGDRTDQTATITFHPLNELKTPNLRETLTARGAELRHSKTRYILEEIGKRRLITYEIRHGGKKLATLELPPLGATSDVDNTAVDSLVVDRENVKKVFELLFSKPN